MKQNWVGNIKQVITLMLFGASFQLSWVILEGTECLVHVKHMAFSRVENFAQVLS